MNAGHSWLRLSVRALLGRHLSDNTHRTALGGLGLFCCEMPPLFTLRNISGTLCEFFPPAQLTKCEFSLGGFTSCPLQQLPLRPSERRFDAASLDMAQDGLLQIPGSFLMLPLEEEDLASMVKRQGIMILGTTLRMCFSWHWHARNRRDEFNLEIQQHASLSDTVCRRRKRTHAHAPTHTHTPAHTHTHTHTAHTNTHTHTPTHPPTCTPAHTHTHKQSNLEQNKQYSRQGCKVPDRQRTHQKHYCSVSRAQRIPCQITCL